jgi:hypothetical protein
MQHVIWVEQRPTNNNDFKVQYKPDGILRGWDCGKTKNQAIKNLLKTIPECFKDNDILIIKYHEERRRVKDFLK